MAPKLIDVHTHTHFSAYNEDRDVVIRRALDAGMWLINVGTQRDTSKAAVDLAHKYLPSEASAKAGVFATVGLHPIHTEKSFHDEQELGGGEAAQEFISRGEEFDHDYYKKLAEDYKVVAIGECGLDYFHLTEETKSRQAEIFKKQIELSFEVKKPLMIHCRDHGKLKEGEPSGAAFADLIKILKANNPLLRQGFGGQVGVIHFFSGTTKDAKELMDLGFSFSFGGVITFPPRLAERSRGEAGASAYEKLVKFIPLDRIVLETDAPYVAPQAYRGKRNEPLYVEEVAKKIARILNKDFEEIAKITTENAIRIFNLK
ncbi:MAG: TatD family hydrolase [bacterium]|nr:TatD family hydrolase [bacterium]